MRQALTELRIISDNATAIYIFAGHIILIGVMVAIGIGAYDWWIKRHPHDK